ncbi:MAG: hypothetical protein IJU23_13280 [Proteobacteria bacterium]|nr:hypothetical protein [Pseudomonadota bacterium]
MRLRTLATAFLFGCLSVGTLSCASAPNIPAREMPAGATFSGLWYTNFGDMQLTQKADGYTRGTFDYKSGGEVEGKVEGGVFTFDWVQFGDFQVGRREVRGKGYLVISDDGLHMEGEWGYKDSYAGGGKWEGNKATEIYR